ncbi:MAG: TonB-dependent siderophore receptor, partial [Janthinobacterium lividum]
YTPNNHHYDGGTGFHLFRNSDISQKALFISDTVTLTPRWSVLAGVRHTNYAQHSYDASGAETANYTKSGITTPTLALMYKLDPDTTVYGSYVESLEAGSLVGSTYANYGALLNPLKSKQYEVGIKTDRERWSATAAVFRIERRAEYANGDNVLVQDGKSIYEGVEVGAATRLGSQWLLSGNLMYLDTGYAKGSDYDGNRVAGAPRFVAAAQVSYSVAQLPGLKLALSTKYTGTIALRPANTLTMPSYTLFNLGASYATRIGGRDVTFRAIIDNLAGRRYWEYQYDNYIKPGDPRTFALNAKIDF